MLPVGALLFPTAVDALAYLGADYLASAAYPPPLMQLLAGAPDGWAAQRLQQFLPLYLTNPTRTFPLPGYHVSVNWSSLRFLTQVVVQGPEGLVLVGFERLLGRAIATEVEKTVQAHWPRQVGFRV